MKKSIFPLVAVVSGVLLASTQAQASVITFNNSSNGNEKLASNSTYTEAGYNINIGSRGAFFINTSRSNAFPGLAAFDGDVLELNEHGASFTLTQQNNNAFTLSSVELGSLGRYTSDNGSFIFTGYFSNGDFISETVAAIGPGKSTYNFTGFSNILSLSVTAADGEYPVLDNIVVNGGVTAAVPEPSTLALLMSGLAAGLIGRRTSVKKC